jgi:MFS family permease
LNWRNIVILSLSQALGSSGLPVIVLLGGIIGSHLAPTPALSTLPVSIMVVGVALFVIPASLLMKWVGRRAGFAFGSIMAAFGSLLAFYAVSASSFFLFCLAALLFGGNGAFIQQYRFSAAESVSPEYSSRAVSFVLIGGIAAGILGPMIATRSLVLLPQIEYGGPFLVLAGINVAVALLLSFLRPVAHLETVETEKQGRSLSKIITQPVYLSALLSAMAAYGVMTFIMTATPLHLHHGHQFSLDQTAWVIQSHVVAMYLPSLFSGFLIERFGYLRVMMAGLLCLSASAATGLAGIELFHFWGSLVLLGVGWNFLFVGATVLLTHTYSANERFKAQAANDFSVFAVQSGASLSAGTVLFYAGWNVMLLATMPVLLLVFLVLLGNRKKIWKAVQAFGD